MFYLPVTSLHYLWLESFVYLLLAAYVLCSLRQKSPRPFLLTAYILVSALVLFVQIAWQMDRLAAFQEDFLNHTLIYGSLILGWLFIELEADFLQLQDRRRWIWWIGFILLLGLVILDSNLLGLPETLTLPGLPSLSRSRSALAALEVSWGVLACAAIGLIQVSYRRYPQPLHRNRLIFWIPVVGLNVVGDGLIFLQNDALGSGLRVFAALWAVWMAAAYDLPDLRRGLRQVLTYSIITGLSIAFYAAGYMILGNLLRDRTGPNGIWLGALLAIATAVLFNPLLHFIQGFIDRLIFGTTNPPVQVLQDYSLKISNILELDRLARVSIQLLAEALNFSRGYLFVVVAEPGAATGSGQVDHYRLEPVHGIGENIPPAICLNGDGPVASYLRQAQQPLTQYDLSLRQPFAAALPAEKSWFSQSGLDVYVPIVAHGEWIGLFLLGPKRSGDRYFAEDLALLGAAAGNTAVALENARLVQDLIALNHRLEDAYQALDHTNQQLEKLDKTKSDFISLASHELRTPLTVLSGYSQMLSECLDTEENPQLGVLAQGIQAGAVRLHEVIECMLDMASIDARALAIEPQKIILGDLVNTLTAQMEKSLAERRITLSIAEEARRLDFLADPNGLRKVFYHILSNAVKYTPDGGFISISGRRLQTADSPLGQESIEILVKDTGIGIAPDLQELIFTKFYQTGDLVLHSSGKTKFKGGGPGLGLAIVRGIVQAHQGIVWAESPGYDEAACPGSTFHMVLPLNLH